jgi:hypothetical protein
MVLRFPHTPEPYHESARSKKENPLTIAFTVLLPHIADIFEPATLASSDADFIIMPCKRGRNPCRFSLSGGSCPQ